MKRRFFIWLTAGVLVWGGASAAEIPLGELSVRGEATIYQPADKVEFEIGVDVVAQTAALALADNSDRMARVRSRLLREGVTGEELQTTRLTVEPVWEPRPRQVSPEWTPKIVSYRARHSFRVSSTRVAQVGPWIHEAMQVGANQLSALRFMLSEPEDAHNSAIALATQRAIASAQAAAQAADVTLVSIALLRVDGTNPAPLLKQSRGLDMSVMSAASTAPPIDGGDIEVHARVEISYVIKP